jgi:hypothetical protein
MLERLAALPEDLLQPDKLTADAGYFSDTNVSACEAAGIEPSIAIKRDEHHPHWSARFKSPEAPQPARARGKSDRLLGRAPALGVVTGLSGA